MVDLIATKRLRYGTRRMKPGEAFEARHVKDAKLLIAIGKARYATRDAVAVDAPALTIPGNGLQMAGNHDPDLVDLPRGSRVLPQLDHDGDGAPGGSLKQAGDDIVALRAEYTAKLGKRPFPGWDAETLRTRMAAHLENNA